MLTSRDLAKIAGVSQITVSRALNNSPLVKNETRQLILQLARENNFELNSFAQTLRTNKTGSIGLLLPGHFTHTSQNLYSTSLFSFLQEELSSTGYNIIPTTNKYIENERSHIEIMLAKKRIDGLIINRENISDRVFELLELNHIPCVFITQGKPDTRIKYSVRLDQYQAGYIVGEYFARKRFKKIIAILGPKESPTPVDRQSGLIDALRNSSMDISNLHIVNGDYAYESGYGLTIENINYFQKAQAVYYQSDSSAIGGIKALHENKINLKKLDIVTGDGTMITEWFSPSLTTVKAPADRIAKEVVQLILKLLQCKETKVEATHIIIQPSLFIRESTN